MRTHYFIIPVFLCALFNCSTMPIAKNNESCKVVENIIDYLKKNDKEVKDKAISIFDSTNNVAFEIFKQEIQGMPSAVSSKTIDSLDHKSVAVRLACAYKMSKPKIKIVFSDIYQNMILCEWFYSEDVNNKNIENLRRFKEAKTYLFLLNGNFEIEKVFSKTIQYE